jgi:hypothetical protein
MTEKSAYWLTIRSSSAGGSKKTTKSSPRRSKSASVGATSFSLDEVHHPDQPVLVELDRARGREVQRDVGRVRPVEHPRREPVVLRERKPVPELVDLADIAVRVLAEIAQQVAFDVGVLAAEPLQARDKARVPGRLTPEHEVGAVPPQRVVPGLGKEQVLQVSPGFSTNLVHWATLSAGLHC